MWGRAYFAALCGPGAGRKMDSTWEVVGGGPARTGSGRTGWDIIRKTFATTAGWSPGHSTGPGFPRPHLDTAYKKPSNAASKLAVKYTQ